MDEPLAAHTLNELRCFLWVTRCAACGRGPLEADEADLEAASRRRDGKLAARCMRCGEARTFRYHWLGQTPPDPREPESINPTDRPSRLVDLGQWVGLYYFLVDQAQAAADPAESYRLARQAYLCLDEALKFYEKDELPPESAFFCQTTREGLRRNPGLYAHTFLRELQAKLPVPAPRQESSPPGRTGPWWSFGAKVERRDAP